MNFKDYKHIELLDIDVPNKRKVLVDEAKELYKIVDVKNWTPSKSYRLRVTAVVRRGNSRKVSKRLLSFNNTTMLKALSEAQGELISLQEGLRVKWDNDDVIEAPVVTIPLFKDAYFKSLDYRQTSALARGEKFGAYSRLEGFYYNHLESLAKMPLDKITKGMLQKIQSKMKHPLTGAPASKRTKLSVLQNVNPVYTWLNDETDFFLKSPAKLPKRTNSSLNNARIIEVEEPKLLMNAMMTYPHDPFKGIFTFALHGRRMNEILSLKWTDINFKKKTYIIRAESNKAGVDMTYTLSEYLLKALPAHKRSGLVFPSLNNPRKAMSQGTLRNHWKKVESSIGDWTLNSEETTDSFHFHDVRHLIGGQLASNNVSESVIAVILGHKRSSITARYSNITGDVANDALMTLLKGIHSQREVM